MDEFHAARLAATTGVNLGFDDQIRGADFSGNGFRFVGCKRDAAVRDGHPKSAKNLLGLIFVDVHAER